MLLEAARRAEFAAKEVLALVGDGLASCGDLREVLPVLTSAAAAISAAQTEAAASVAVRERHGDGGAEVLASAAGLSRREAKGQVKTAATLSRIPVLREAVESGRVPKANARQLATAVEKAGAGAVESDSGLLEAAETMRPEQFATEARRWSVDRQGDDGAGEHARQRAHRRLRVWDGDDGMVHLHGEFDKVAGTRIANRLRHQARRMLDTDKKTSRTESAGAGRRSFDQCMADALDELTGHGGAGDGETSGSPASGSENDRNGAGDGETSRSPASGSENDRNGAGDGETSRSPASGSETDRNGAGDGETSRGGARTGAGTRGAASNGAGSRTSADICVMVHADDVTGKLVAELPDRTRLPRSVLDALSCDAAITGVICDRQGSPIWRSYASRRATEAQKQILFATYGGCFHCGANPGVCQIHHIEPVWLGGKTRISNLVPVCWGCHSLIHERGWWILKRTLGHHTMHPPDGARHGPAHESDHPVLYRTALPASSGHCAPAPADSVRDAARRRRGPPLDGSHRREPALF